MFALSKPELRRILAAVASASVTASVLTQPFGRRDYLLMLFLYHTGLRDRGGNATLAANARGFLPVLSPTTEHPGSSCTFPPLYATRS